MMTNLMMLAGIVPWGFLLGPLGMHAQSFGVGVQVVGVLGLIFLGLTGQWGM